MGYKCSKCGREAKAEEIFVPIDKSYDLNRNFNCPECWEKRSVANGQSFLISCLILVVAGFVWILFSPANDVAWLVFESGLAISFIALAAVPHEFGHALAAFAVRHKVFQVTIGIGKQLFCREFLGIEWRFCSIPICGYITSATTYRSFYRIRDMLVYSGGALMNLLLALVSLFLLLQISNPWWIAIFKMSVAANLFVSVFSLIPSKVHLSGSVMQSDGLTLLKLPFLSSSTVDGEIEWCFLREGYQYSARGQIEKSLRKYEEGLRRFPNSLELQSALERVSSMKWEVKNAK